MPFQSFWMRVIIFIFRKINWHPIQIQYSEFIHTCLFCFGVNNNLKLIRYPKQNPTSSAGNQA